MVARGDGDGPRRAPGAVVAGRYRLVASLGRGAFGEVWDADDLLLGERVALKRLSAAGPEPAQARREIATLRLLRFPGVVHLLDEGDDEGHPFFVTELVRGAPFPGNIAGTARAEVTGPGWSDTVSAGATVSLSPTVTSTLPAGADASPGSPSGQGRLAWSSIAPVVEALLRTLDRVHAAGVVHRDLKPANVLVRADGQPVVLDFGLCLPTAEGLRLPSQSAIQGTPAYLSPEQIRGGPIDARADLYAVGVMIYESLTGCLPHDAPTVGALFALRASQRAVPVRDREPAVPPDVAAVVDGLLATAAARRPRSAAEVLERLRLPGASPRASFAERDGPCDAAAARSLFTGRERLFHLRTDAAAALHELTGGDPARLRAETDRWLDTGFARRDGDRLVVDRDALDRFAAGLSFVPGRLVALVSSGEDSAAVDEALVRGRDLAMEGRLGLAAAVLEEGLSAARRCGAASVVPAETALLAEWVKVAFAEHRPRALDRVLYEVCRARARGEGVVARLEVLLRAAISARTFLSPEPAAAAEALGPFEDPALERWRRWLSVRTRLMSAPHTATAALAEACAWAERAGDTEATAAVSGLRGSACYLRGQFVDAAHWHREAAGGERWITLRIGQMLNEASALLEAFEPVRARETAERAAAIAAACRHPYLEGRAEATARTAGYRAAAPMTPDLELVEAQAEVDAPEILGVVCFTEAAIAHRGGDRATAAALASRAAATLLRCGQKYSALLAQALAGVAGEGLSLEMATTLAAAARSCAVPGIGIQVLGLVKQACPGVPAPPSEVVASLCAQIPEEHWGDRLDVLSVDEARRALQSVPVSAIVD